LSDDKNPLIEALGTALLESKGRPTLKGSLASGLAIALLSVTHAVPEAWELWVQWPLFGLFVLGVIKIAWELRD